MHCLVRSEATWEVEKHSPPVLLFRTHLFSLDNLAFGPHLNQLHLICLSHLTTSEAIFTSLVKTVSDS